ncbi:MAG TPA: cytidine deaminase [Daejeonella sp.]|nr:cytidine deaminase [Daejeonella sp.]
MQKKNISISFYDYASIDELDSADQILCREAEKALLTSYSPYSGFKVGAAVQLQSGKIIYGSNQESVAFPSGLCAERTALFSIGAQYPNDPIKAIAITAHTDKFNIESPVTPCGSCLQVLGDFEQRQEEPIRVLLYCLGKNILVTEGVKPFLPLQFMEERLSKAE